MRGVCGLLPRATKECRRDMMRASCGLWRPLETRECVRRRGFRGTLRPCESRGCARCQGFRCFVRPFESR
eukprot:3064854-Pyramimonas_sp.AAC.1